MTAGGRAWARAGAPWRPGLLLRGVAAALLLGAALLRLALYDQFAPRMDETFLMLLGGGAAALLVPWERLTSLKAGKVEITVERPAVRSILESLPRELDAQRVQAKEAPVALDVEGFREQLRRLEPVLREVRGARVLWIENRPHMVLAERRLLRSLGFNVVPVPDSEAARLALVADNDYDLVITDTRREGLVVGTPGRDSDEEGVAFVVRRMRTHWDAHIKSLPVLFYSARPVEDLARFTRDALAEPPGADYCNTPQDLVMKAAKAVWFARLAPLAMPKGKQSAWGTWRRRRSKDETRVDVTAPPRT